MVRNYLVHYIARSGWNIKFAEEFYQVLVQDGEDAEFWDWVIPVWKRYRDVLKEAEELDDFEAEGRLRSYLSALEAAQEYQQIIGQPKRAGFAERRIEEFKKSWGTCCDVTRQGGDADEIE
jgi:hypothetical protein